MTFTADEACHVALGELRSLLRHEIPDGDLAKLLKRAVSAIVTWTVSLGSRPEGAMDQEDDPAKSWVSS